MLKMGFPEDLMIFAQDGKVEKHFFRESLLM